MHRNEPEYSEMTASTFAARPSAPRTNWIATVATYGFTLAAIAAFALLGVEESRVLLIG